MKSLTYQEKIDYLRLARSENVGPITFQTLIKTYGSALNALKHIEDLSLRGGKKRPLIPCSVDAAEREYEDTYKTGGELLVRFEDDFPEILKKTYDCPPILSVLGNRHLLKNRSIAVVGTRNCSINAANMTRKLALELSKEGITVVSGLALGIDACAHEAALSQKGSTIAVQGCGIDVIYPLENKRIYEQIRRAGLIVSEFPIGSEPKKPNFPRRNRIISGLSSGIAVIEATVNSGSLITARYALEQGRDVFAVPGFPLDPRCEGPNSLIKQGAFLLTDAMDIINEMNGSLYKNYLVKEAAINDYSEMPAVYDQKDIDDVRENIVKLLSASEISVDDLILKCEKSAQVVAISLAELELAGRISRNIGNKVSLIF